MNITLYGRRQYKGFYELAANQSFGVMLAFDEPNKYQPNQHLSDAELTGGGEQEPRGGVDISSGMIG
jgi:hypothetical protein